jgi:hypothetical protein
MIGGCTTHNANQAYYTFPTTWENLKALTGDASFAEDLMRQIWTEIESNEDKLPFPGHGYDGYISTSFPDQRLLTGQGFLDEQLLTVLGTFDEFYPCSGDSNLEDIYCLKKPLESPFRLIADRNGQGAELLEGINLPPG